MQHTTVQVAEAKATPILMPETMAASPAQLMMQAQQMGMTPEVIGQMMDLQARHMKDEAKRAFDRDFAAFGAERPSVHKNKEVKFGTTKYTHATLDHLVDTVGPILARHGFSHNWQVKQEAARVHVTCVLRHRLGHSESVTLESGLDSSGQKNPIQQMASAVSYLRRYTFEAVTGVATSDEYDDDGRSAGKSAATVAGGELPQFIQEWVDYCKSMQADPTAFKKACAEARSQFNTHRDMVGLKQFNAAIGV